MYLDVYAKSGSCKYKIRKISAKFKNSALQRRPLHVHTSVFTIYYDGTWGMFYIDSFKLRIRMCKQRLGFYVCNIRQLFS